ncbi:probable F-box protein At4g22030 [Impatiens glandulifera]|uniref:probable F-box protein At4g22030 n=1 Tax=Impatiens glandulifera TaxID=253017 RepID=UPI001FB06A1B|nr:probable F-box protein At4g22030 [Impatiens glandulifera]
MAAFQISSLISSSSSFPCRRHVAKSTINHPNKLTINALSLPDLSARVLVEELQQRSSGSNNSIYKNIIRSNVPFTPSPKQGTKSPTTIPKLYAIMEAIADRIEMHRNIKEQRENWNSLLLNSVNAMTLTAATISAIAAAGGSHVVALSSCSSLLYMAATGLLIILNKIQPSQLAEEQRNAARLFQKLRREIQTKLSIGNPESKDHREAMDKVLALDRAYPLPLLGKMLEKFPEGVEPAKWWPEKRIRRQESMSPAAARGGGNGWDEGLEERMKGVVGVLRRRDKEDYLRLGEKALKLNKMLGIAGPVLTTVAAVGSALMGPSHSGLATVVGVAAGAMAAVINAVEHGGQVGMVFEMYRSNAGFFSLMEEWIEGNLEEKRGINGNVMEMKVALELGRSLSELRDLTDSSLMADQEEEFGSKLF